MDSFSDYGDDYYFNVNLGTEMELPQQRDSVLHFFEQVKRRYPNMQRFYHRERTEFVLEEGKDEGSYRWVSLEARRVNSGFVNPLSLDEASEQHRMILDMVPHMLTVSTLDCESISLVFGFDYNYRGNQSQLLMEALGLPPALEQLASVPGTTVIGNDPSIILGLDDDFKTQARVSFETRNTAASLVAAETPEEQLSVYLTIRRFDSLATNDTFVTEFNRLEKIGRNLIESYMIEHILLPLRQTIAMQ
jgi:hypothetical protein